MKKLSAKQKEDQERWKQNFRRGLTDLKLTKGKNKKMELDMPLQN